MKYDPVTIRRALARLPSWMQKFFTWLTAIALPDEKPLRPWTPESHVAALCLTWILVALLGCGVNLAFPHWPLAQQAKVLA